MLDQITPVILTYNEAPNIARTLERLAWARDIVIVDSFSDDETLSMIDRTPQVRVFQREFDSHENQWNFALGETDISSEWVLALDADYVLTPELVEELREMKPAASASGYQARFIYCVNGRPLRGSAYPPVTVLYRREGACYRQDGHTQRVQVPGNILSLRAPILHDDRKSFDRWLRSQSRYMKLEAEKLAESSWRDLGWADRLRKLAVLVPFAILFYCLFIRRAILDGRAGLCYSFQRLLSELLLSVYLLERPARVARAKQPRDTALITALTKTNKA